MFNLFLNGFPESLILVLMLSVTLLISTTDPLPKGFCPFRSYLGPRIVDRFSNAFNAHLPKFNSTFRVLGTEAVDAFSVLWTAENNWLVQPVHCIIRVIQHLLVCSVFGTLVVPYWPSDAFWPFLFASSLDFQPYVVESIYFPDPSGIFVLGCYKDSLIGSLQV